MDVPHRTFVEARRYADWSSRELYQHDPQEVSQMAIRRSDGGAMGQRSPRRGQVGDDREGNPAHLRLARRIGPGRRFFRAALFSEARWNTMAPGHSPRIEILACIRTFMHL